MSTLQKNNISSASQGSTRAQEMEKEKNPTSYVQALYSNLQINTVQNPAYLCSMVSEMHCKNLKDPEKVRECELVWKQVCNQSSTQ